MRERDRLKIYAYIATAFYVVIFVAYGLVKYDFTHARPEAPDVSSGRVKQIEGFYMRQVYVTQTEQKIYYILEAGMEMGFVLVFAAGALYWRSKR